MSAYDDNLAIREIGKAAWQYLGSSRKLQIILAPSNRGNGIYIPNGIFGAERAYLDNAGQEIRDYLRNYMEPLGLNCGVEFLVGAAVHEPAYVATPTNPPPPPQNPTPPPVIIPPLPPTTPPSVNDNIYYV